MKLTSRMHCSNTGKMSNEIYTVNIVLKIVNIIYNQRIQGIGSHRHLCERKEAAVACTIQLHSTITMVVVVVIISGKKCSVCILS